MKKITLAISVLLIAALLLTGCFRLIEREEPSISSKPEATEEAQTLDEVLSGTWKLYAGYDENGNLVYEFSESAEVTYTFDVNDGFAGVYRDGSVDASFSGIYDCSDSKLADKDPYNWYYYATINRDDISDSGSYTYVGKLGEQALNLMFKFRDLNGQIVLYEDMQSLYFTRLV